MDVLKRFEQLADEPVPVELGVYSMGPWSVSKLKTLERCPLQFYLAYVAKVQLPKEDEDPDETLFRNVGTTLHAILEAMANGHTIENAIELGKRDYIKIVTPERWYVVEDHYPSLYKFWNRIYGLSQRVEIESIDPEIQLAIDKNFKPVSFFSDDAFFRGVEDFSLRTAKNTAIIIDHKRGGNPSFGVKIHRAQLNSYMILEHFGRRPLSGSKAGIHFIEAGDIAMTEFVSKDSIETLLPSWLIGKISKAVNTVAHAGGFDHNRTQMCKYCDFQKYCKDGKRGTAGKMEQLKIATFKL